MLERQLAYAKVTTCVAMTFMCLAVGVASLYIGADFHDALVDVHASLKILDTTTTQLTATTKQVGNALTTDVDRLTTHADRLMIVAGATATEAHKAAQYQRAFWETQTPELARRATILLDNSNRLLESSNTAILGLNDTNTQVRTTLDQVAVAVVGTADEGQKTFQAFRAFASDPDFLTTKHNVMRLSAGAAQMTEDAAYKFHYFAHPEDLKGKAKVWHYTLGGVRAFGDLFRLIYFWP